MRAFIPTFFLIYFCVIAAKGQDIKHIKSNEITPPTNISIDRAGNVYFSGKDGDIFRLNPSLEKQAFFSPSNPATTNILEAWQGLRIFTFHKELQKYRLINRNLSLAEEYDFPPDLIGFAEIATPTFDNNIWVIDQTDFSLKKYVIHSQRIESKTPLDLVLDQEDYQILHCREYQNRLFVSTLNNGILIFDNFGNFIKTMDYLGVDYFNFWQDDLYFILNNSLVKLNLYNDKMSVTKLPEDHSWDFVLIFDQQTYLMSGNNIFLYQ
jgi:hypothetical protein